MLALWMTALLAAQAPAAEPVCRVAVLNLVARGLPAEDADVPLLLTEVITNEVAAASGCDVISPADIRSMVDFDAARQGCDVESAACLSDIGAALGVERLVAGTLGRLGSDYVVSLRLVDLATTRVERRTEEVVTGQVEKLRGAAKQVARGLFADTAAATTTGPSLHPLVIVGGSGGVLGVAGIVTGGLMALEADRRLGDPTDTTKGDAFTLGRAGVITAVVGCGLAAVGATVMSLAWTGTTDDDDQGRSPTAPPAAATAATAATAVTPP
jgi:hypothetical protein